MSGAVPVRLTEARSVADRYIARDGGPPASERGNSISAPPILEQIIADTELLAIHGNDLDQCEACDVWLTMEEAVRCDDGPTLCPHQAYGGPKFANETCYRDRPWRHAHRMKFDQAEAVRRTAELMDAERKGEPAQFHGGITPAGRRTLDHHSDSDPRQAGAETGGRP